MDAAYSKSTPGNSRKRPRNQSDNGKHKRQNPSNDDSKAIETVYRILCPIKKIGSVLGKGGDIINALRNETNAKIRVTDAIPGAEERVIIIYHHSSDQLEISDVDTEQLRPYCPAQYALLKVHDRIAADEYFRNGVRHVKAGNDENVTARILVPSNQVGCLIGKAGTVIEKLRSEHRGANIRVLPVDELPPCAMNRDELVQISGPPEIVKNALYDISTRLHEHPRKDNPPIEELMLASTKGKLRTDPSMHLPPPPYHANSRPLHHDPYASPPPPPYHIGYRNEPLGYPRGSYDNTHIGNDLETPEEFSIRILCPSGRIGGVIGKAGATVREIEQATSARIQIEDVSPDAEERIINVSSRESPWDQVSPTIEAVLRLQIRTCKTSEDGKITNRLIVSSSKVGCLLGQRGSIINEMRRVTRADITVCSKEDKPHYLSAKEELVQISGKSDVVREALLEILSRLRTRTFRIGDPPSNPAPVVHDYEFSSERMHGRLPSPHTTVASRSAYPAYPSRGYSPPEYIASRGPAPYNYEYPKGPGPIYTPDHGYPSGPPRPPHEAPYAPRSYPAAPPPPATGYDSRYSTMEVKIPSSAASSVIGVGGSNISEISQISGARVKVNDPHPGSSECIVEINGSSEQIKAAQSLIQAFVASSRPSGLTSSRHSPVYRQY